VRGRLKRYCVIQEALYKRKKERVLGRFEDLRKQMVVRQLAARGLSDAAVLRALSAVPREQFVATELVEFAYRDSPLPIAASQTISQPYIVALMTAALHLKPGDRVLEIGTGSGYAAAVLAEIAGEVYSVERHKILADTARKRLLEQGYANTCVLHGDGTLGWAEHAPYDAIVVAAGGPDVPSTLKQQLAVGGRLVIPVGSTLNAQKLLRITRVSETEYRQDDLGDVRFVPLIGAAGWEVEAEEAAAPGAGKGARSTAKTPGQTLPELIYESAEHFGSIDHANLDPLLARIGDSRVVMLGEASHGTAEFYDMRSRITQALIEQKGFSAVVVEADWPDASHINHFIHGREADPLVEHAPFSRFPTWMWANHSVMEFVHWLKTYNLDKAGAAGSVDFYGLDLYSLGGSIEAVLTYLDAVDPETAEVARVRYGCLSPWTNDTSLYARMTLTEAYRSCEQDVLASLQDLLEKRLAYSEKDGDAFFNAEMNARLIASAERYYRTLYYAESNSWNQRDQHMFETLEAVMAFKGDNSRVVVWAHNSHIGDARATQMSARGELNIGQLVRQKYADAAYLVGFGTDHGTVAAASEWGGPMEKKQVQPAHIDSYERVCHEVATDNFFLPLRHPHLAQVRQQLLAERLERAIGVIYRPESELQSHYFYACLPHQFDEYLWFDETTAVLPLVRDSLSGMPDTFPFGL
jgi:protein-L-isoaspartate(D-aspartate) O-methyltransferase